VVSEIVPDLTARSIVSINPSLPCDGCPFKRDLLLRSTIGAIASDSSPHCTEFRGDLATRIEREAILAGSTRRKERSVMSEGNIRFLGTGTAFNHDGRGSQSLLVSPVGTTPFLVDAGPTVMSAIMHQRVDCRGVDRLFLTHLHGDHTAGWPFLLLHFVVLHERRAPFEVYGPVGTEECLEELARRCYGEVLERRRFDLRFHELEVAHEAGLVVGADLSLETWPMRHHSSSIGLRFGFGRNGRSETLAVSGDTGWCEGLERLATGAGLLVLECTTVHPGVDVHLSLDEIRDGMPRLGAKRVILNHLTDEVAEALAIDPIPGLTAAHDGMDVALEEQS
jgi:ribonuclease BN (tRNA processing enzyme)